MNIHYVAGFVDGEGYLGIIKKSSKKTALGYYYVPVIKICQITKKDDVLYQIANLIGTGNYYKSNPGNRKETNNYNKATWLEYRGMTRVCPIAKNLVDHLIIKKRQAEILIEFGNIDTTNIHAERMIVDSKREKLYKEILLLNRRGLAETK